MNNWNIKITAENEAEALKIMKTITEMFEIATKNNLPLDHIYCQYDDKQQISLVKSAKE